MAAVDYVLPQDCGVKLADDRLFCLMDPKSRNKGKLDCATKHISRWESIPHINYLVDDSLSCDSSSFVHSPDLGFGQWRRSGWRLSSHLTSQSAFTIWGGAPRDSVLSSAHYTEAKQSFDEMDEASDIVDAFDYAHSRGTSIYRGSISSNISDVTSCSSLSSSSIYKPRKGNDVRLVAIKAIRSRDGVLELKHFRVLSRLGKGDTGAVYLTELIGTGIHFAMKVMDKEALEGLHKFLRAQTEKEILQSLDHPFLPTLYAHFETERYSYMLMEFCPGGDLHFLRQRRPEKCFTEHAARFYMAEVLLALEYLHMLGVIYRDLKPENVLVREDGHIMLSDFNLSLRCVFRPSISRSNSSESNTSGYFVQPICEETASETQPACFVPTCCSSGYSSGKSKKGNKSKQRDSDAHYQVCPLPELIAEPTSARSMSIVGTHEYLAPEIIRNEGYGSAVDWWTLGIFLYELLFGNTPFKGSGNQAAILNIVGQPLRFPESPSVSFAARDLIRGLLVKDSQHRLGYRRGATEIKQHPFFQGVNWALVRCACPPEVPRKLVAQKLSATNMTHTAGYYSSDIDLF